MSDATDTYAESRRVARALEEVTEGAEETAEVDPHPDRTRTFHAPSFSRMRTRWTREEQSVIDTAMTEAEYEIRRAFGDAYIILDRIYEIVRIPKLHPRTGEIIFNSLGGIEWDTDEDGMAIEDFSKLTHTNRENFVHQITTRLVSWEQRRARFWGEAMFAKGAWEERFSRSFVDTPVVEGKRPTEADRTHHAQSLSFEERYLSLYKSMCSKQADGIVSSMERIAMRMKEQLL